MNKILLISCIVSISFAQQTWEKTYGGPDRDVGYSVVQTSDGGYIVAGNNGLFGQNTFLVRTNAAGDTVWTRTYGLVCGHSIQSTRDNCYIIAGGLNGVCLLKINPAGDSLWTRMLVSNTSVYSVQQTFDGGYIATGRYYYSHWSYWWLLLLKTDSSGTLSWYRTYGTLGSVNYCGYSVQQTPDSGYIVTGRGYSGNSSSGYDVYLIKTDTSGYITWSRMYGRGTGDEGRSVQQTRDGGYIIAGIAGEPATGSADIYLIKTNATGDTLWTRVYGRPNNDWGYSVQQTPDDGYIIVGSTCPTGDNNVILIKTDSLGNPLWKKIYGGALDDRGHSIKLTQDGGFIIAGSTTSYGAGNEDFYLIKTDGEGNIGLEEKKCVVQDLERALNAVPNPFTSFAHIPSHEKEYFVLADISGRLVGTYEGSKIGENLSAGVYFLIPQKDSIKPIRIVKVK